jgi:hypothetical protein
MSIKSFNEKLEKAVSLADIFELVKHAVRKTQRTGRAGLTLGLADLGGGREGFVGAFYPFGSNIIVMNKAILRRILTTKPELYRPYSFIVLLHEYLHSLGYLDESIVREKVQKVCNRLFGGKHLTTQLAEDMGRFIPELVHPEAGWSPQEEIRVEMVYDFDRSSMNYIM